MTDADRLVETQDSWLTFLGDRVLKVKKPVRNDLLDLTGRQQRRLACQREVDLNRRLAPDVYLGVLDLLGRDGQAGEHAVLMRRLPADRRLATLVGSGADVRKEVRRIAERVTAFHAGARRSPVIDRAGRPETLRWLWDENLDVLAGHTAAAVDGATLRRVRERAHRYLIGRTPLLESRVRSGAIVDGHGDLLAEDIFCLPDGPRILDCLDVDDTRRHGDVLADIASLAMDLERLGAPADAAALLDDYRLASGSGHPASLADWYIAYRAVVQAKVACLRPARSGDGAAGEQATEAGRLLRLADRHLAVGRVRLVLVGGPPGTGKSTVAEAVSGRYGWPVIRSDVIRRQLAGVSSRVSAAPGRGIYRPEWTGATYSTLLDRAEDHLGLGQSVLLDATWADPMHRAAAVRVARRTAADLVTLDCQAPPELALSRIQNRPAGGRDASEATPDVYRYLAERAAPWPEATPLDTRLPLPTTLSQALRAVNRSRLPKPHR